MICKHPTPRYSVRMESGVLYSQEVERVSLSSLWRKPGISVPSIRDSVARGQRIAEERHLVLT